MSKDIQQCIKELSQSPIFALSKGNNELSHTNFWAWLIEEVTDANGRHPFVKMFIPEFYDNNYEYDHVGREDGHRDLSVYYSEKGSETVLCHVVENKLKSIPTKEQLIGYEDVKTVIKDHTKSKKKVEFAKGTLTGIEPTLKLDKDLNRWEHLTYDKLAERIESIAKDINTMDADTAMIIREYICDIQNISNVIKTKLDEKRDKYVWDSEELEDIKLGDLFLKLNGCKLKDYINDCIENNSSKLRDDKWGLPTAECSFNNKKPTITVTFKQEIIEVRKNGKREKKEVGRIGVQIEGDQFRIYGGPSIENSALKNHEKLYKFFYDEGWFYDVVSPKKEIPGCINGMDTKMKGGHGCGGKYCKYVTKEYTHVYQYWDLKSCSFKSILNEVIKNLKRAKDIIKDLDFTK